MQSRDLSNVQPSETSVFLCVVKSLDRFATYYLDIFWQVFQIYCGYQMPGGYTGFTRQLFTPSRYFNTKRLKRARLYIRSRAQETSDASQPSSSEDKSLRRRERRRGMSFCLSRIRYVLFIYTRKLLALTDSHSLCHGTLKLLNKKSLGSMRLSRATETRAASLLSLCLLLQTDCQQSGKTFLISH